MHDDSDNDANELDVSRIKILEGIARRLLLTARYNGQLLSLAPHALITRHGELFLRALNLSKNWRDDEERRLGHFKVAGLAGVMVTEESFDVLDTGEPLLTRPEDDLVLAIS